MQQIDSTAERSTIRFGSDFTTFLAYLVKNLNHKKAVKSTFSTHEASKARNKN